MNTFEAIRVRGVPATNRVHAAWAAAQPITRRAVVAAAATSAATATVGIAPPAVRWCTAAVGVLLAVAALVDVHERRLPNRLLGAAAAVAMAGSLAAADARAVALAVVGGLLGGGLVLLVRLTRGVGMGDVKMAAVVGAGVGPASLVAAPVAIAVAALVAAAYGVLARRPRLPLGPSLWFGWVVAVLAGAVGWLS